MWWFRLPPLAWEGSQTNLLPHTWVCSSSKTSQQAGLLGSRPLCYYRRQDKDWLLPPKRGTSLQSWSASQHILLKLLTRPKRKWERSDDHKTTQLPFTLPDPALVMLSNIVKVVNWAVAPWEANCPGRKFFSDTSNLPLGWADTQSQLTASLSDCENSLSVKLLHAKVIQLVPSRHGRAYMWNSLLLQDITLEVMELKDEILLLVLILL